MSKFKPLTGCAKSPTNSVERAMGFLAGKPDATAKPPPQPRQRPPTTKAKPGSVRPAEPGSVRPAEPGSVRPAEPRSERPAGTKDGAVRFPPPEKAVSLSKNAPETGVGARREPKEA